MNKIIVTTGYMGSGSSAVTDLLKEYDTNYCPNGSYEYVFLHCPNGLFDLEDQLLIGNNAIKSDYAIRTFKKEMMKLYNKKHYWVGNYKNTLSKEFMNITNNYIDNLIQFKYKGFWYNTEELNRSMYFKLLFQKPFKILSNNKIKFKKVLNTDGYLNISFIKEKEFYDLSKNYIYKLLNKFYNGEKNIILDQLLLPFNLFRIDNYFNNDLKVIVVERDPRDLFVLNKYSWKKKSVELPFPTDVQMFCKYYKNMRESEVVNKSKKVMRIFFEDLVYKYENTKTKICEFLDLKEIDHKYNNKFFDPTKSINNTQVFRDERYLSEIKIIEKELKDYIYHFPQEIHNKVENSVVFRETVIKYEN